MSVVVTKTNRIGPGVRSFEFEVHKNAAQDDKVYRHAKEIELRVAERMNEMKDAVEKAPSEAEKSLEE
jgi:hypothetical protein